MASNDPAKCTALHVGKFYPPHRGGMETYLRDLLMALHERGIRCLALVHRSPGPEPSEPQSGSGPKVVRVPVWANLLFTPISPGFPWRLNRLLRDESPAVLHLHMPNVSVFWALFLPRARRIPWVVHWQADVPMDTLHPGLRWFYRLYRPFERWILRRAKVIVASSPPYMQSSAALAPFLERSRAVPLGLREPRRPDVIPKEAVSMQQKSRPHLKVIAVGRLTYYKGFDVLIRAVELCSNVELEIVGEGEQKYELSALIEQLKMGEKVRLLGNLSDQELDQRLRASDCLCLPSIERTEAFGVVLLEAMARSKACLVTAVPGTGMSWIVEHEHTGLVVPPNDADALAKALSRLAENRALCKAMGEAGRARFSERFTIDASAAEVAKIYSDLTKKLAS